MSRFYRLAPADLRALTVEEFLAYHEYMAEYLNANDGGR